MTDETTTQPNEESAVLKAIAEMSKQINGRIDGLEKRLDAQDVQFEAIRQGIVSNNSRFDRLEANFLLLRADVRDLAEEVHQSHKVLA